MNNRSRIINKLKTDKACCDNPDLSRKFVRSMMISLAKADEAIQNGFMGPDATQRYIALKSPTIPAGLSAAAASGVATLTALETDFAEAAQVV